MGTASPRGSSTYARVLRMGRPMGTWRGDFAAPSSAPRAGRSAMVATTVASVGP